MWNDASLGIKFVFQNVAKPPTDSKNYYILILT